MRVFKILFLVFVGVLFSCNTKVIQSELIELKQFNYPVLKEKENNPVLRVCINSSGGEEVLQNVKINIGDSTRVNLSEIRLFYTGKDSILNTNVQFGKTLKNFDDAEFSGFQVLSEGDNYLWVSYRLTTSTNLVAKLDADLDFTKIDGKYLTNKKENLERELRVGVAVRQHWQDSVHTYRIPGLATSEKGTLLAVYDVRRESGRDLQGHMDIGLSRSFDAGKNWEPMQIALDMKTWGGLPEKFNGVSDACILVDKANNDIYIAGLWMHGVINAEGKWLDGLTENSKDWNHQWRTKGSQPGLSPKQTSQFYNYKKHG